MLIKGAQTSKYINLIVTLNLTSIFILLQWVAALNPANWKSHRLKIAKSWNLLTANVTAHSFSRTAGDLVIVPYIQWLGLTNSREENQHWKLPSFFPQNRWMGWSFI